MDPTRTDYAEQNECNRLLAECRPFMRMSPQVRAGIAALMRRRSFAAGEHLMTQGDEGTSLMVLAGGQASVILEKPGQENTLLRRITRTHVVGEMALITQGPRTATVVADTDVDAFVLPAKDFDALANKHPQVTVVMTDLLSDRLGVNRVDAFDNKLIEGYRIEGFIARGAMAIVYEVVQEETGEHLALKMMDHRLVYNSDALARFNREATIAASHEHPNLVKVFEKLECFRTFFLVMEFCDGPSLAQMNEMAGPLPESEVRKVLGQLYSGLTCLHEKDITHRDVKLSNVLSTSDGTIKLADFGLARPEFEPDLTDAGIVVGTPAYMAPEQFEGKPIGPEVDFYALGCLAFELLTGEPLFDEPSFPAMMAAKMKQETPARADIRADLSDELYEVMVTALNHDPSQRQLPRDMLLSWVAPLDPELVKRANWEAYQATDASTARIVEDEGGGHREL